MKPTMHQILIYTSNSGGGWVDCLDVPAGQSVAKLFQDTMAGQQQEDFRICINRRPVSPDTVLRDGDRVTITPLKIVTLIVLLAMGSIQAFAKPLAKGPYLGQTPPGSVARIFAPGLISKTRQRQWESFGHFSAQGDTFCYIRYSARGGGIFISENTSRGWTRPQCIETIGESHPWIWSPCLSPDANSIYFTRAVGPVSKCNMYRSDRTAHGWTEPQSLGPPRSSPAYEVTCCIAMNNSMYFGSKRKYNTIRIWFAPFVDNTWARADRIILDHPHAGDAGIAPDESFMVFTAKDPFWPQFHGPNRDNISTEKGLRRE